MLRKAWAVIRREFSTRVRTRWFVISTLSVPLLLFGTLLVPLWVGASRGDSRIRHVVVLDVSQSDAGSYVGMQLVRAGGFVVGRVEGGDDSVRRDYLIDSLRSVVELGGVDGFLVIGQGAVPSGVMEYYGQNAGSAREMRELESALQRAISELRLREAGIDMKLVADAAGRVQVERVMVRGPGRGALGEGAVVLAYLMAFTLYIALFVYGQSVLRSVVEEKTTRIVEVLASSMRPATLLGGKVLGVGAVGMFQLAIWVACGYATYRFRGVAASILDAPDFSTLSVAGIGGGALGVAVAYFVLGFFLFSTLYAAAGAVVTSEQEAQHAQLPVTLLLVPGILLFPAVLDDPTSGLAAALGLVPFSSPIVMPARWIVGVVSPAELAGSLVILLFTTVVMIFVAAKIYRVGILMYGKRATFGEIARWLAS